MTKTERRGFHALHITLKGNLWGGGCKGKRKRKQKALQWALSNEAWRLILIISLLDF